MQCPKCYKDTKPMLVAGNVLHENKIVQKILFRCPLCTHQWHNDIEKRQAVPTVKS